MDVRNEKIDKPRKMKDILIIKSNEDSFERYYNKKMKECGCVVQNVLDYKSRDEKIFSIKAIKRLLSIDADYLSRYQMIIVFEAPFLVPFLRLKVPRKTKIILWNWNLQNKSMKKKEKVVQPFCEIWTFDPGDAKKYGWKLNNQFYCPIKVKSRREKIKSRKKAFCACVDKGRYKVLKEIYRELTARNIDCDFTLVKQTGNEYDEKDQWVKGNGIPYDELLQRTIDSDIIIDLVQKEQVGITVRTLEAIFYNKKLITNNAEVKELPLYNPRNIFVWGIDEMSKIDILLNTPCDEVPQKVKNQYTVRNWLDTFDNNKNE